jgi:hypothetical protein
MSPATPGGRQPDALRDIYLDAVAEDRGPDAESRERILAHARLRAGEMRGAPDSAPGGWASEETQAGSGFPRGAAANDRHWRRHALGGIAALGLVGWLMLQHPAWWAGGSRDASPAPAAEALPQPPADAPAGMAAQLPPAAVPPAPGSHALERTAPAAAQDAAKAMAVPQGEAQPPWCPDDAAEAAEDAKAPAKAAQESSAPPCRPRKNGQDHKAAAAPKR